MKLESFWTETAASFAGRSDALPAKADVAIIGGGFTGLSAARALARRGAQVVVLEARAIAAEASGRNGGHVNNGLAVDTVERVVREEEIACDFRRGGKLKLASRPSHYEALARGFERLRREADPEVLQALVPHRRTYTTTDTLHNHFRTTPDNRLVFGGRARFALSSPRSEAKSGVVLREQLAGNPRPLRAAVVPTCRRPVLPHQEQVRLKKDNQ